MTSAGQLMGGRVSLTPRPKRRREPALVAALLGHLPGAVRLDRLRPDARALMREAGLGEAVDHLDPRGLTPPSVTPDELARIRALEHLPIPLAASAELDDIFPDARADDQPTGHRSLLAGSGVWLPQAVDDFFANGGERLWIVRIPPGEGRAGFQPRSLSLAPPPVANPAAPGGCDELGPVGPLSLLRSLDLRGLATLLPIPEIAVIAAPDLERLLIAAGLPEIPRVRIPNAAPRFVPCGVSLDDDHRERRHGSEIPDRGQTQPDADEPACSLTLIRRIAATLATWRPDCQYLHTLPLTWSAAAGMPALHPAVAAALTADRGTRAGAALKRVQLLWPYLRGPRFALASPTGVIAGRMAAVARAEGPWRSVAGRALVTDAAPWPPVGPSAVAALRVTPGVGVLVQRSGRVELEDERLAVPALHADDYLPVGLPAWGVAADPARWDGWRAGEVVRFIGFLLRRLRALGDRLVFDLDPRDPRPRLLLEELFRGLHAAGALRGALPEEGFRLREGVAGAGIIAWDIELAPAFPIDRLRLSFVNRHGEWQAGLLQERTGAGVLND
ncbi:hypothetical protein [Thiohalocapsa sp. ML1]|uniref:hypothetical protein n=1 Tax=Thiohalocapsa sp. ML1 TaxID=1431688 RepID=UPI00073240AE|nr:hypothetical protein [Thiohalocapsa sp. ML1]